MTSHVAIKPQEMTSADRVLFTGRIFITLRLAHPVPSSSVVARSSSSDIVLFVLRTPLRPFSLGPLIRIERCSLLSFSSTILFCPHPRNPLCTLCYIQQPWTALQPILTSSHYPRRSLVVHHPG